MTMGNSKYRGKLLRTSQDFRRKILNIFSRLISEIHPIKTLQMTDPKSSPANFQKASGDDNRFKPIRSLKNKSVLPRFKLIWNSWSTQQIQILPKFCGKFLTKIPQFCRPRHKKIWKKLICDKIIKN